ncbi:LssY C-terminal domain-containing protein [Aureimonas populi]|uniref:LssY C-terminal domain-containing protein n=1 Tax=Aureimonas populi TaxID=1701758 RepID=A0ABW5CMC3_9HYPH|nr:LssY C-terminal domain-containing protein [Aureimonas populi]
MIARRRRALLLVALLPVLYALLSYLLLPDLWYERDESRPLAEMLTRTADDLAGDPINVEIVGARSALVAAMNAAGWAPADPITARTSADIIGSVLLDRPYRDAPVSPLFYDGRREDLAFEKAAGISADRRQHVRLWAMGGDGGQARWLGAVTFDAGVGLSHYTGQVTHDISPRIDDARQALVSDLEATGLVAQTSSIAGRGATDKGRNGEGDLYVTDGRAALLVLR